MRKYLYTLFVVFSALLFDHKYVMADPPDVNTSLGGVGADYWTGHMARKGLFILHTDNCVSGEAFVELISATAEGFCIEQSERSAANYEDARQTCFALGKRLPEAVEYKFACNQAVALSLSDMTDDWEWASNFMIPFRYDSQYTVEAGTGLHAATQGGGGCDKGSIGYLNRYVNSPDSIPFRCVR